MYITVDEVRRISGADSNLISDSKLSEIIQIIEDKTAGYFDFKFIPTKNMEFIRDYDLNNLRLMKQKIMTIQEIRINDTSQILTDYTFDEDLGKLQRNREYDRRRYFDKQEPYRVKVKYTYAMLKPNGTVTETTVNSSIGTSVALTVEDETQFYTGEYIRIKGFDGGNEVAKILSTAANTITVDQLFYDHESGSIIEKLKIPEVIRQYMLYDACTAVAIEAVGSTYTKATGYTFPEYSVQIGVPYVHWQNNFKANLDKLKELEPTIWALKSTIL